MKKWPESLFNSWTLCLNSSDLMWCPLLPFLSARLSVSYFLFLSWSSEVWSSAEKGDRTSSWTSELLAVVYVCESVWERICLCGCHFTSTSMADPHLNTGSTLTNPFRRQSLLTPNKKPIHSSLQEVECFSSAFGMVKSLGTQKELCEAQF